MTEHSPRVSVILPTYNRAHYLRDSIDSVLNQSFEDFELIIVDDGSTDKSREVIDAYLKEPRVHYHYQENAGCGGARNTALTLAKAPLIAVQDSDDIWMPRKLERQLDIIDRSETIGLVYGKIGFFREDPNEIIGEKYEGDELSLIDVLRHRLPATQTMLFRREVMHSIGGFLSGYSTGEDYVFFAQVAKDWELRGTSDLVAKVRQHPGQVSAPTPELRDGHHQVLQVLYQQFGHDPACKAALDECRDFYRWVHFRQFNDAAREAKREGKLLTSLRLRMQAIACDARRALPGPIVSLVGTKPQDYWGR